MLGQIPGLCSVEGGKALGAPAASAAFTQGYDWALVVKLETAEDLPVYEGHSAHKPYVFSHTTGWPASIAFSS